MALSVMIKADWRWTEAIQDYRTGRGVSVVTANAWRKVELYGEQRTGAGARARATRERGAPWATR